VLTGCTRGRGITRVVTPASMAEAYYERLGWRRDDDTGPWTLEL
jgi:hypothetical protein